MNMEVRIPGNIFKYALPLLKARIRERLETEMKDVFDEIVNQELAKLSLDTSTFMDATEKDPVVIVKLSYESGKQEERSK